MCKMAKHQSKLLCQANKLSQSLEHSEVVPTVKKPHKNSYKAEWEAGREWLLWDDEVDGTFCRLCKSGTQRFEVGNQYGSYTM